MSRIMLKFNCDDYKIQKSRESCSYINALCQNQKLESKILENKMSRYFLRPFFDISDAFFPFQRAIRPTYRVRFLQNPVQPRPQRYEETQKNDPHALFEQFFKENEAKTQAEKEFFQKHYPEAVEDKFDPYKTLEISKDASLEEAKEAYRKLAIKYHPKNDSSPEAETKFADVAKAYQTILDAERNKHEDKLGFNSFFDEFEKSVQSIFYPKRTQETKGDKGDSAEKPSKELKEGNQATEKINEKDDYGVLYSESSHYESANGRQTKFEAEKYYKKDGKLLKVKRQERLKDDGNVQITQTIDNGQEVKKKTFIQEKGTKQLGN